MTGDIVISELDARMYVVLSEAEEHVSYGELVGTREYILYRLGVAKPKLL